jgi:hypothetical protein
VRAACLAASLVVPGPRDAEAGWPGETENDGVYGRFGGNTDLSLKLGGHMDTAGVSASLGVSAHYYSTVGLSLDYLEGLSDEDDRRGLSAGAELRPLFLPRFLLGRQRGPAWFDLTLDSLSLGLGAYWSQNAEPERDGRGLWLSAGFGLPLTGHASGPWMELRGLRRFPDPSLELDAHNAVFVYLSWHHYAQLGEGI